MKRLIPILAVFLIFAGCAGSPPQKIEPTQYEAIETSIVSKPLEPKRSIASDSTPSVNCKFRGDLISFTLGSAGSVLVSMTYSDDKTFNNQTVELNAKPLKLDAIQKLRKAQFVFNEGQKKCSLTMLGDIADGSAEAEIKCAGETDPSQIGCKYKSGDDNNWSEL